MNEMRRIRLYAIPTSPYAMKVGCYLAFKQLDYELVGVNPIHFREVKFTGTKQVPVLQIGDEWKLESSDIGHWLDELYPERPLLGSSEKDQSRIVSHDEWITDQLIPSLFRVMVDWPSVLGGLTNGWKLGNAVNELTSIPVWVRLLWPIGVKRAGFIVAMVNRLDRSESVPSAQQRLLREFVRRLEGGPFLGGMEQPTLADLSAFPVIAFAYRFGITGSAEWFSDSKILAWCHSVQSYLPENPFLVHDKRLINRLPETRLVN